MGLKNSHKPSLVDLVILHRVHKAPTKTCRNTRTGPAVPGFSEQVAELASHLPSSERSRTDYEARLVSSSTISVVFGKHQSTYVGKMLNFRILLLPLFKFFIIIIDCAKTCLAADGVKDRLSPIGKKSILDGI